MLNKSNAIFIMFYGYIYIIFYAQRYSTAHIYTFVFVGLSAAGTTINTAFGNVCHRRTVSWHANSVAFVNYNLVLYIDVVVAYANHFILLVHI